MQFKDYYQILGVPVGADADVIKTAYRKLARKFHPDVSKEKNAEDRFKDINEAYEVLRDAKKRKAYDGLRARGYRPGEEFNPPPNFGQDFNFDFGEIFGNRGGAGGAGGGGDAGGFSDFFESLFGGRARGGAGPGPRPRQQDLHARIEVDLETAFAGGMQRVGLEEKTLDIKIPAGVQPGQQIRLRGQAPGGADVLLEIGIKPHRLYALEGRNLTVKLPVTPWEAALGATVEVPTLKGPVELRIPAGSKSGKKLRLKGRGLPGTEPGDQFVVLEIHAPPAETDAERKAHEAFKNAFPDFAPRSDL